MGSHINLSKQEILVALGGLCQDLGQFKHNLLLSPNPPPPSCPPLLLPSLNRQVTSHLPPAQACMFCFCVLFYSIFVTPVKQERKVTSRASFPRCWIKGPVRREGEGREEQLPPSLKCFCFFGFFFLQIYEANASRIEN